MMIIVDVILHCIVSLYVDAKGSPHFSYQGIVNEVLQHVINSLSI